MFSYCTKFGLLFACVAGIVGYVLAAPPSQVDGVLVLRNGYVLTGRIWQEGEVYVVKMKNGEVRMAAERVDQVGRSLQEVYQRKRAALSPDNVPEVLDLTQWCMQQQMLAEAKDLVAHALTISYDDSRIAPVARQVQHAIDLKRAHVRLEQQEKQRPRFEPVVVQATYVEKLPSGAVESFTHRVQPLLLNRCGTAVCHGSAGKSKFRLQRPARGLPFHSRLTQANLTATLRYVKRDDPQSSPLLLMPTRSHGTARRAVFSQTQANQLAILTSWVHGISQAPAAVKPATITQEPAHLSQASSNPRPMPVEKLESLDLLTTKPAKHGVKVKAYEPRDEFDPELFNRRFHSTEPTKEK